MIIYYFWIKTNKLYDPFLWTGFNFLKAAGSLQRDSVLFTTNSPGVPGTGLIDHGRYRRKYHTIDSKKPGFSVSVGLTKRRYLLLSKANGLIKGNTNVSYVCNDINCSLALRFKDNCFKYFNSEKELHNLLND